MAAGTVRHRIRFFACEDVPERAEFDLDGAVASVAALDDGNWRYASGDMTTAAIIDHQPADERPACLRFFRLREGDDVPHKLDVERATTPVEVAEGEAITDWTHVVIWPDGYAAHDPHRDAPSLARLAAYFREKTNERVNFVSLFDRNLIAVIALLGIATFDYSRVSSREEKAVAAAQLRYVQEDKRVGGDALRAALSAKCRDPRTAGSGLTGQELDCLADNAGAVAAIPSPPDERSVRSEAGRDWRTRRPWYAFGLLSTLILGLALAFAARSQKIESPAS